jgi:hypothetical protein
MPSAGLWYKPEVRRPLAGQLLATRHMLKECLSLADGCTQTVSETISTVVQGQQHNRRRQKWLDGDSRPGAVVLFVALAWRVC